MNRIVACIVFAALAATDLRSQSKGPPDFSDLGKLFGAREFAYDPATSTLKAGFAFANKSELLAFDDQGEATSLIPGGGLSLGRRTGISFPEVRFEAPVSLDIEFTLHHRSSIVSVIFIQDQESGSAVHLDFGLPSRAEKKWRRNDGVARTTLGVKGPAVTLVPSALAFPGRNRLRIEATKERVTIGRNDQPTLDVPLDLSGNWSISLVSMFGGADLHGYSIAGVVLDRSMVKLRSAVMNEKRSTSRMRAKEAVAAPSILRTAVVTRARFDVNLGPLSERKPGTDEVAHAGRCHEKGEIEKAMTLIQDAVKRYPKLAIAHRELALQHMLAGELTDAKAAIDKAHGLDATSPETLAARALIYLGLGDLGTSASMATSAKSRGKAAFFVELAATVERIQKGPFTSSAPKIQTARYRIVGNVQKEELELVAAELERFRTFLETDFVIPMEKRKTSTVWIFDSRDEYDTFLQSMLSPAENSLGVFNPSINTLMFFMTVDMEAAQQVLFHEGFHQYLSLAVAGAPHWFNEGLAEYYATTKFDDEGKPVVGGVNRIRLSTLNSRRAKKLELAKFEAIMTAAPREFMSAADVGLNYAQSWAMVHYFLRGSDDNATKTFEAYRQAILVGKDRKAAWQETFGALEASALAAIEAGFAGHVSQILESSPVTEEEKE